MVNPVRETTPSRATLQVDGNVPEHGDQVLTNKLFKRLLWALFILLYVPILYYRGWLLPPDIGIDYPSWRQSALMAFVQGKTPYGLDVFNGIPGFGGGKMQPYIYPPPSLLAFWPLAHLGTADARIAFILASHLCFLGSMWLILFRLTPLPKNFRARDLTLALSVIYILSVNAVPDTFGTGQVNFFVLLFICLAMVAFRKESSAWRIALPLSVAILLKTYPVFLILLLFFNRRYKAVVYTCAFFAAFTAVAYFALPHTVWHTWLVAVVPLGAYANNSFPAAFCWNQSINAFVMRLFQENYFSKAPLYYPALAKPVATGLATLVLGVTCFYSYWSSRAIHPNGHRENQMAAFFLMTYLVAPLSWDHHLVYLLPVAVLAISLLVSRNLRGGPALVVAASLILIAWRFPIDRWDIIFGWRTLLMSAKFYPVVVLWLFFIRRLSRSRNSPVSSPDKSRDAAFLAQAEVGLA